MSGPWAIARYLPLVRLARTPARLAVVVMLGLSVLFAAALVHIGDRRPQRRRLLIGAIAAVMFLELMPVPRPLYSAAVPRFYAQVAGAGDIRLLELPVGVRDGTSSVGNFTARSQFFQTAHGKPLIGGYLSRVSRRRVTEIRQDPMLDALITLSEGGTIDASRQRGLVAHGADFSHRTRVGFVVIDRLRASPALQDFAVRALHLRRIDSEGEYDLYAPAGD